MFNYTLNVEYLEVKPGNGFRKIETRRSGQNIAVKGTGMTLALLLFIFLVFIAIIFLGRFTEYAMRKKVIAALAGIHCPGCKRPMGRVKITPLRKARKRSTVSVPQEAFPSMYRVVCQNCGKTLTCEIERGGIRFY